MIWWRSLNIAFYSQWPCSLLWRKSRVGLKCKLVFWCIRETTSYTVWKWKQALIIVVAFNDNTYHTVVTDNHDLQILHFLKYTARHLQNKNHHQLSGSGVFPLNSIFWKLWPCTLLQSYSLYNKSRVGELKFATLLREGLTARFFLRFSQDKSSSSEKNCSSSSTANTHKESDTWTHILFIYNWVCLCHESSCFPFLTNQNYI